MIPLNRSLYKPNYFEQILTQKDSHLTKYQTQQIKKNKKEIFEETVPNFRPYIEVLKSMKGYLNATVVKSTEATDKKLKQISDCITKNTSKENIKGRPASSQHASTAKRNTCKSQESDHNSSTLRKARQFLQKLEQVSIHIPEYNQEPSVNTKPGLVKNTVNGTKSRSRKTSIIEYKKSIDQNIEHPKTYLQIHQEKRKLKLQKHR